MITFTQLRALLKEAEVSTTARESIVHLQSMKDVEFIEFMRSVKNDLKGKLSNIPVTLKVDGAGYRVGKDTSGRIFVETSRSGPIYDTGAFTQFNKNKGVTDPIILARSAQYDDILEAFKGSKLAKSLPNDTKVVIELLYNPMAESEGEYLKFVSIKYDRAKLGTLMTIIPIKVLVASTGKDHPDEDKIMSSLMKLSTPEIKIVNPTLKMKEIDISTIISPLDSINADTIAVLNSRKQADKAEKLAIKEMLQKIKDQVADYIINHESIEGKDMLGKNVEGLVLKLQGKLVKVTTQEFKDRNK